MLRLERFIQSLLTKLYFGVEVGEDAVFSYNASPDVYTPEAV
jgi:hypothetical protein